MLIRMLPSRREVTLDGRMRVGEILRHLGCVPGTVMVIRGEELLSNEDVVANGDTIEVRNVISGG